MNQMKNVYDLGFTNEDFSKKGKSCNDFVIMRPILRNELETSTVMMGTNTTPIEALIFEVLRVGELVTKEDPELVPGRICVSEPAFNVVSPDGKLFCTKYKYVVHHWDKEELMEEGMKEVEAFLNQGQST